MATTQIPPEPSSSSPLAQEARGYYRRESDSVEFSPVLLTQLQDELARSRLREAFWISVIVHIVAVLAIALAPKYLPGGRGVVLMSAEDMVKNKDMTFLELPPDEQKVTTPPRSSKIISDKDRIATSRAPQIDKKTLDELRSQQRPGPPGPPAQQPQQMAQAMPPGGAPAPPAPSRSESNNDSNFNAPAPPKTNPFNVPMSAGDSIAAATRAAARPGFSGAGVGGNYGLGGGATARMGNIDILSDTMGVDFGPYLSRVLQAVRMNWYNLIPEVARPPLMKKGKVTIQFVITHDGKVEGMRIESPSGDIALDRAAWGGITASNPFPPLPGEFRGPDLALRFRFFYNPDRNDLQ